MKKSLFAFVFSLLALLAFPASATVEGESWEVFTADGMHFKHALAGNTHYLSECRYANSPMGKISQCRNKRETLTPRAAQLLRAQLDAAMTASSGSNSEGTSRSSLLNAGQSISAAVSDGSRKVYGTSSRSSVTALSSSF